MPVDEFGREIPGVGGGVDHQQQQYNNNDDDDRYNYYGDQRQRGSPERLLHQQRSSPPSSTTPRGGEGQYQHSDRGSSGYNNNSSYHHYNNNNDRYGGDRYTDHNMNDRHRGGRGGGDRHYDYGGGGGGRSRSPRRSQQQLGSRFVPRDGVNMMNHMRSDPFPQGGHHSRHRESGGKSNHQHHHHHRNSSSSNQRAHPSEAYMDEPMLCEFVWKDQQKEDKEKQQEKSEATTAATEKDDGNATAGDTSSANAENENEEQDKSRSKKRSRENDSEEDDGDNSDNGNGDTGEENTANNNNNSSSTNSSSYDEYRLHYALNYVRSFFNRHLDDSWFRNLYSPSGRVLSEAQERHRARDEAQVWSREATATAGTTVTTAAADGASSVSLFVKQARLGGGVKLQKTLSSPRHRNHHRNNNQQQQLHSPSLGTNKVPLSHRLSCTTKLATMSHKNDPEHPPNALYVSDIPPHVTDEQVRMALLDHCSSIVTSSASCTVDLESSLRLLANAPSGSGRYPLEREAVCLISNAAVREELLRNLKSLSSATRKTANDEKEKKENNGKTKRESVHVPRKGDRPGIGNDEGEEEEEEEEEAIVVELNVECTDAYGRFEIDADGKGTAPLDGLPRASRKSIVVVSTRPPQPDQHDSSSPSQSPPQPVTVLSASLSSKERIPKDKDAALTIAAALDNFRRIPEDFRLATVLSQLFPEKLEEDRGNEEDGLNEEEAVAAATKKAAAEQQQTEDMLDVAISYLRRVHLCSFYTGCSLATSVADVLIPGKHAAGTVHLRLQDADVILEKAAGTASSSTKVAEPALNSTDSGAPTTVDRDGESETKINDNADGESATVPASAPTSVSLPTISTATKDLLVQRLDNAIAKVLTEQVPVWEELSSLEEEIMVSKEVDAAAEEISNAESQVQDSWLQDHSIDDDGRARCSFHFCHKLFKDSTFLHKHLLKKHKEYLRAEQAKCHDTYMMEAWDKAVTRPVPDLLVDCGVTFGLRPSPVSGGQHPMAADPEPELWRKEEERRQREQELQRKREEMRLQRQRDREAAAASSNNNNNSFGGAGDGPRPTGGGNFVDVDDMKEEKVEMAFDDVKVPPVVPAKKKKKKKRKLL